VKTIRERRLNKSWPLAAFLGTSVLLAGCGDTGQEAPEQLPVAPQVAPPIEQQDAERAAQRDAEKPQGECVAPAEEIGTQQARRHARPSKGRTKPDRSGVDGGIVFESGPSSRSAQSRKFRGGPGLSESGEMRMDGGDVASKPIVPAVSQQRYEFGIYMGTPDQTRGVRGGLRVDSGDPPAYSTMKPITPNVSESTVLPEMQSGSP
jgi:hypothetical protein